jgi:putative restriction endonuclease
MRYWVGITDEGWASYLRAIEPPVDEVNFWHPGGGRPITLSTGDLWVFKRKVSLGGEIIGGAWYVHWSQITPTLAWDGNDNLNRPHFGTAVIA